jgi:hypothetical protein
MLKESKEKFYDLRMLERNIYKGLINPKEYKKYLQTLPDESENAEEIDLDKQTENKVETPEETATPAENTEKDIGL